MKIENIAIGDIKEYENNPRNNIAAIEAVKESIEEFGFLNPIIIDKDNIIVAGHTRVLAAQTLGMKEVPGIIANELTEEQIKAFRIADNKVAEIAEWDNTMLAEELRGLQEIDMTLFGFTEDEKNALLNEIPDFGPGTIEEQGDLTKLEPKIIVCPCCGERFDLNELKD